MRSSSGAAPTAFGYTGQRADSATGLDFYHARYDDPVAQQFVSADSVNDGLSRYAYTGGNPTTMIDPSGHQYACPENECGGAPPTSPTSPTTTTTTTTPTTTPTNGAGKTGNKNGDSTDPCVADPSSDACHEQERNDHLQSLHTEGALMVGVGFFVLAVLALAVAFNPTADIVTKLQALITFVTSVADGFSYLPNSWRDQANYAGLLSVLHGLAALANRGLMLLEQMGFFARATVTAATDAAEVLSPKSSVH